MLMLCSQVKEGSSCQESTSSQKTSRAKEATLHKATLHALYCASCAAQTPGQFNPGVEQAIY
jgi:hypothetical protein